ncbi:MAG TPA: translocation/assembly module TamB domain-containing protein, partial [bacterium]|nr:translocation/assembly module TamB domain-containing protein [bacterium]
IASGCVATAGWLVNRPEALRHALALANMRSSWKVEIARLNWSPFESRIALDGLSAREPGTGKYLSVGSLRLGYRILGLIRGKLVIEEIDVESVDVHLPKTRRPERKPPRKRLNLARLVLLRNLELAGARIGGLKISLGESSRLEADEARLSLIPALFSDTKLAVRVDGMLFSKDDHQIVSAGQLSLKTSTDLARWEEELPYVNALKGVLKLSDVNMEGLRTESLSASLGLDDGMLRLKDLKILFEGKPLQGWLTADISDGSFDTGIDMPSPIALPHFWRPMETMDLGGKISGRVRLEGEGFVPSKSEGRGRASITHVFDAHPEKPISVSADLSWGQGSIRIPNADILVGEVRAAASGNVDLKRRNFRFEASGKGFPLEALFMEFREPHIRKIFGPTDFSGSIEGWGKDFKTRVTGTTLGGGWAPITAERIETVFEATYDDLMLQGDIFSGDRKTGEALFKMRFGPKIGKQIRSKFIELEAKLVDHPVDESLAAYGLSGTGNGRMTLTGPHTSFKGEVDARIERGSIYGLPFDVAASKLDISRRQIEFFDMSLKLPSIEAAPITGDIIGDIGEGSIRLHGGPIEGLSLDATYRGQDSRWSIKDISWSDPEREGNRIALSGSVSASGGMDLRARGRIDLGALAFLAPLMREGSGPVDIDLSARGSADNPRFSGNVSFNDNGFSPRGARLALENLSGDLRFEGSRVRFEEVRARIDDGEMKLKGHLDLRGLSLASADMAIEGSSMRYRSEDSTLSLELDGSLSVKGAFPSPLVKGDLTILDGKYSKDFTLLDAIAGDKTAQAHKKETLSDFDPKLDLRVRNSGDLAIRNNVGDIWLNMNVGIRGTRKKPVVSGSVETTEGEVHYLGMEFDITKGFIEFMERYQSPYLEVTAQREVGVYNITLILHGPTDNLALDLSATSPVGPLEKRDVISLLLFGVTEQERTALARNAGTGGLFTTQMAGQALSGILGRPIQKAAGLDVFRLEASAPGATNVSRVYFGKKLTDRLSVNFATDINTTNAVQTVIGEYQITDNLLLTGQRSSDSSYRVTGSLRFRLR